MNRRTIKKVNGGIAIFYGIGAVIAAIFCLIATGSWLYQVFSDQTEFSWGILTGLIVLTVVMGLIAYSILRVGHEELDN